MDSPPPGIALSIAEWRIVRAILTDHVPDRTVCAFGSRTGGSDGAAKPWSDLDLAIMGEEPLPQEQMAGLREAFAQSDLAWKVDLLDWADTADQFRDLIRPQLIALQSAG